MKWGELIMSKGQSLIELLIALGIFLAMVSVVAFLLIDGYISNLQASQNSQAISLAEEGIEAVRSIRDSSWDSLTAGPHGLTISGNNWIFQGGQEDVSHRLREGIRKIIVEEIGSDRKKVISQITWELIPARPQELGLVTYLTNWQKYSE